MQSVSQTLRRNLAYVFIAVGLLWLVVGALTGSAFAAWPVVACILSGILLKAYPDSRLTTPWASATAIMGLFLSAYQVYAAAPLLSGAFATIAGSSMAIFFVFGVFHLLLLAASRPAKPVK